MTDKRYTKEDLRNHFLTRKDDSFTIDVDGYEILCTMPTMRELQVYAKPDGKTDIVLEGMQIFIRHAFVPDTKEPIFNKNDLEAILNSPEESTFVRAFKLFSEKVEQIKTEFKELIDKKK